MHSNPQAEQLDYQTNSMDAEGSVKDLAQSPERAGIPCSCIAPVELAVWPMGEKEASWPISAYLVNGFLVLLAASQVCECANSEVFS